VTDQQQQPTTPPANATEAQARLSALKNDQDWGGRLMSGDVAASKEFRDLTGIIAAGGDAVEQAIAGIVPGTVHDADQQRMAQAAVWMEERGLRAEVIRQTLTDYEVSPQEVRAVKAWKAQKMRSPEFTKAFLAGEPEAVREILLADIVLSSPVKTGAAA
jgi:hypothetical protein